MGDIFEIKPNPVPGTGRQAYYIKSEYYTPYNIQEGERLFIENCAICHGKEAAGNGLRAGTMEEAKPRMLTNLDWIETRDDLRLLQSIKYGVPGTAMIPWGDATSTLQRLQLVIFIRSLSRDKAIREHLSELLYQTFDKNVETIRQALIVEYRRFKQLDAAYRTAKGVREDLDAKLATDQSAVAAAVEAYRKELQLSTEVKNQEAVDDSLDALIKEVKRQKEAYNNLANNMLARLGDIDVVNETIDLIGLNAVHYAYQDGQLSLDSHTSDAAAMRANGEKIVVKLDALIASQEKEKSALQGQLPSAERQQRLHEIDQRLHSYTQAKEQIIFTVEEAARSRDYQANFIKQINAQMQTDHGKGSH